MSRWQVLKSEIVQQAGFFRLRIDECKLPDGRIMPRYHVIEFPDWVNVVPITDDGQMVLVRQYRHAAGQEFLEIPGGGTDPKKTEDPRVGGERELLEETGYRAKEWVACGFQYPNPALQTNRLHTFLALGCEKVAEPSLDPFEDLTTELMPVAEVLKKWREGFFQHALIASSLGLAMRALNERGYK
jgi:8-oxo-dGTP pyrophosphatase MutT (NUDIX family)